MIYKSVDEPLWSQEVFSRNACLTIIMAGEKRITTYDLDYFEIYENEAAFSPLGMKKTYELQSLINIYIEALLNKKSIVYKKLIQKNNKICIFCYYVYT